MGEREKERETKRKRNGAGEKGREKMRKGKDTGVLKTVK